MKKFNLKLLIGLFTLSLAIVACSDDDAPVSTVTPADFAGTYTATDNCSTTSTYDLIVAVSGDGLVITNLANLTTTVNATVSGSSLTIAEQNGDPLGFTKLSGSGTLSEDKSTLTINYTLTALGIPISCSVSCAKQ